MNLGLKRKGSVLGSVVDLDSNKRAKRLYLAWFEVQENAG